MMKHWWHWLVVASNDEYIKYIYMRMKIVGFHVHASFLLFSFVLTCIQKWRVNSGKAMGSS